jgi:Tfp pilus assembly protein PilN
MKINLVPEVKQEQIKIAKINMIVTSIATIVGILLAAVVLILITYNLGIKAQISRIDSDTRKINQELEAYKDLEQTVISLETGLREIKSVLSGGAKWTNLMGELEKATPADIVVNSFAISGQDINMELTGREVKSIDRFLKSFSSYSVKDQKVFTDVAVNGYNKKDDGTVSFSSKMKLTGGLLW